MDMSSLREELLCEGDSQCPYAAEHGEHKWTYGGSNNPPDAKYWSWAWGLHLTSLWVSNAIKFVAKAKDIHENEVVAHMMETPCGTCSASVAMRDQDKIMSFDVKGHCKVPGGYTFPEYKQDLTKWDGVKACKIMHII